MIRTHRFSYSRLIKMQKHLFVFTFHIFFSCHLLSFTRDSFYRSYLHSDRNRKFRITVISRIHASQKNRNSSFHFMLRVEVFDRYRDASLLHFFLIYRALSVV